MSGKKKSKDGSEGEELIWATGMSRWMARKGPDGTLPDDIDDPALVLWIENQRRDYWKWKQGRRTSMEKEAFDMLGNFGFDWGDEAKYTVDEEEEENAAEGDNAEAKATLEDEDDDMDHKPRARTTTGASGKKRPVVKEEVSDAEQDYGGDDEPEPPRKAARSSSRARRTPRESVRSKEVAALQDAYDDEDDDNDEPSGKMRRRSSRAATASKTRASAKGSTKPTPQRAPKEEPELRTMQRIVPVEEEGRLIDDVKEEFKDLLVCVEPLNEDKENGILAVDVKVNQAFEDKFLEFLVFQKAYGHAFVPKVFPENPALGRWCCKLRHWRNTNSHHLTESRSNRLDAAGFVWNPKADKSFWKLQAECVQANDLWEENFQDLLKFREENGHVLVPKEYQANKRLARWVLKNRRNYKAKHAGEYHLLDDEREQRLIDLGFVFYSRTPELMRQNVFDRFKDRWAEHIVKLREFKEKYGHCAVPRRLKDEPKLASWAMRQRAQWRKLQAGQPSYLTPERLAELEEVGFVFGEIDRREYPVDQCGVWPKPYQLKKRSKKGSNEDGSAEEAAKVVAVTLGTELEEKDADEASDGERDGNDEGDTGLDLGAAPDGVVVAAGMSEGPESETLDEGDDDTINENEAVAEEFIEEEPAPAVPMLIKGRWTCITCAKDEFMHFIDACAHEAACSQMVFAQVDPM